MTITAKDLPPVDTDRLARSTTAVMKVMIRKNVGDADARDERRKHNDLPEPPPADDHASVHEQGGDAGGDFHDAGSLHASEHRPRDNPDALSVSDHLVSPPLLPHLREMTDRTHSRMADFTFLPDPNGNDELTPPSLRLLYTVSSSHFL